MPNEMNSFSHRSDATLIEDYAFDAESVSRRLHRIWAHLDGIRELPEAKELVKSFESTHRSVRYRNNWGKKVTRCNRLIGFESQSAVSAHGTVMFYVNSPEIPAFGRLVSYRLGDSPVIYSSVSEQGRRSPYRYFVDGRNFSKSGLPLEYQEKFAALEAAQIGIEPENLTIDLLFPIPRG